MAYDGAMRTTLRIRDEALELCRRRAEEKGVSLGDAVSEAILDSYRDRAASRQGPWVQLPESGNGGLQPGVDLDDSAALEDLMSDIE